MGLASAGCVSPQHLGRTIGAQNTHKQVSSQSNGKRQLQWKLEAGYWQFGTFRLTGGG